VNALRTVLYEYGLVVPQGIRHLTCIEEIIVEPSSDLPELVREECRDLIDQIMDNTTRIETKTARLKELAAPTDIARRLQTMPGVGPLTALAVDAFAPDMCSFKSGRDSQHGWGSSRGSTPQEARRGSVVFRKRARPTFAGCSSSGRCRG